VSKYARVLFWVTAFMFALIRLSDLNNYYTRHISSENYFNIAINNNIGTKFLFYKGAVI